MPLGCDDQRRGYGGGKNSRKSPVETPCIASLLTPVRREDEAAAGNVVAVFAEVNALPGAHVEPPPGDGNGHAAAQHRSLQVGRHVVGPFVVVAVVRGVFGHHAVEVALKVLPHGGVGVLVDGQRGRSVLDEHVQQAHFDLSQFREFAFHHLGD